MGSLGNLECGREEPWHSARGPLPSLASPAWHLELLYASYSGACWEMGASPSQEPPTSRVSSGYPKHSQFLAEGSRPGGGGGGGNGRDTDLRIAS